MYSENIRIVLTKMPGIYIDSVQNENKKLTISMKRI